jgi:hypothetical protein
MITLTAALGTSVEDYRFANRLKTDTEAVGQLLELELKAAAEGGSQRQKKGWAMRRTESEFRP